MIYVLYVAPPARAGDVKLFGHQGEPDAIARQSANDHFDLMHETCPDCVIELFEERGGPPIRRIGQRLSRIPDSQGKRSP